MILLNKIREKKNIEILDLVSIFVVIVSVLSMGLLAFGSFSPKIVLLVAVLLVVSCCTVFNVRIVKGFKLDRRFLWVSLFISLTFVVFRIPPYPYITGGQDQGTYTNMAAHISKHGNAFVNDEIRAGLSDAGKAEYDRLNQISTKVTVPGKFEGKHVSGVYVSNLAKSEYVFQFYHLHAAWLSIFGVILDDINETWALTFFSILSIIFLALIGYYISGKNIYVPYVVALFLSINTLHAFFSRLPLSEITTLAFSSGMFYYLLRAKNKYDEKKEVALSDLLISLGLYFGLSFTHVSAICYLIFLMCVALVGLVLTDERKIHKQIILYYYGVALVQLLSMYYYMKSSYPYLYEIFGFHLRSDKIYYSVLFVMLTALFIFGVSKLLLHKFKIGITIFLKVALLMSFAAIISYGLYITYYFTYNCGHWREPSISKWLPISYGSFEVMVSTTIFVLLLYVSPIGFYHLIRGVLTLTSKMKIELFCLIAFITYFMIIRFQEELVYYQFYFARYLFAELVPYILVLATIMLCRNIIAHKKRTIAIIVVSYFYFLFFSSMLAKQVVDYGAYESSKKVVKNIGDKDLFLIYKPKFRNLSVFILPLKFFHNKNVVLIDEHSQELVKELFSKFNNVYVISQKKLLIEDYINFEYFKYSVRDNYRPPYGFRKDHYNIYKYKLATVSEIPLLRTK